MRMSMDVPKRSLYALPTGFEDPCKYANDGECDVPEYCSSGDFNDCKSGAPCHGHYSSVLFWSKSSQMLSCKTLFGMAIVGTHFDMADEGRVAGDEIRSGALARMHLSESTHACPRPADAVGRYIRTDTQSCAHAHTDSHSRSVHSIEYLLHTKRELHLPIRPFSQPIRNGRPPTSTLLGL